MSKKAYTDAEFSTFVAAHQQQHGADAWPSADAVVRELGGGKTTARDRLDAAKAAAQRPIAFSDGLLAALTNEVRAAQDAVLQAHAAERAELRAATEEAEAAREDAERRLDESQRLTQTLAADLQRSESARGHLAEQLGRVTAEATTLRAERDEARTAVAVGDARTSEYADEAIRLRAQVDLLHCLIQRAPVERPAEPTPAAAAD